MFQTITAQNVQVGNTILDPRNASGFETLLVAGQPYVRHGVAFVETGYSDEPVGTVSNVFEFPVNTYLTVVK